MRPLVKWLYIHVARSDRKCEGGGEEANGNKFKLNCYIYMHAINNWSRDGHIRVRCANRERVRKVHEVGIAIYIFYWLTRLNDSLVG